MTTINVLYVGNDNILELQHLRDELTGDWLTTATVQVTLFNASGVEVGGDTWPKPMDFVADSKGVFRVTLPHTLDLLPNERYTAEVTVDGGAGKQAMWPLECVARPRC